MRRQDFLLLLDDIIEEKPGTLTGTENLAELDGWDSFATLEFITLVDKHFGMSISGENIINCRTVAQLLELLDGRLS